MTYRNLINVACADKTEFFCRMRDYICRRDGTYNYSGSGIGWTLYDSSYAVDEDNPGLNDWYVLKTVGEGGKIELYVKVTWVTNNIAFQIGNYWNTTTNSFGTQPSTNQANTCYIAESDVPILSVYGDLDVFYVPYRKTAVSTQYYMSFAGRFESAVEGESNDVLTATSTYTAGSDVSMTFNETLPADWVVGNSIMLLSGQQDGYDVVEIKSVNAGTKTITVDLTDDLPSATVRASRNLSYCYTTSYGTVISAVCLLGRNGSGRQTLTSRNLLMEISVYDGIDPDPLDGKFLLCDQFLWGACGIMANVKHMKVVSASSTTPAYNDTVENGSDVYRVIGSQRGSGKRVIKEV